MRVLRLTPFFHHDCVDRWPAEFDSVGGMQIQILRLSRQLADRGIEQQVLTVGFPGLPKVRTDRDNLTVRVTRAPMPRMQSELTGLVGLNQAWLVGALAECVALRRHWRPHLIHVHADGQLWALLAGPLAARMMGAPYCVTLHCSRLSVYEPMSRFDRLQHNAVARAERWALKGAAAISTLTDRTAGVVADALGVQRQQIDVLPDSVEPTESPIDAAAARAFVRRLGVPDGAPVVGYVGRIAHEKGWQHVVEVARRVADTEVRGARPVFLIVGDGPQRARMEHEVAAAGLSNRFTFTGFLPHHDIPAVMTALDVLVMPSVHEELGGSAIEAMMEGLPVVAYAVGGLQDTIGRVCPALLVPPGDVHRMAATVSEVLDDGRSYRAAVRAGRSWLIERFGVGQATARTIAHYRRAMDRTDAPGDGTPTGANPLALTCTGHDRTS